MLYCPPPYDYRPSFIPSDELCSAPTFVENRARLWAGGTFFRSKEVGPDGNEYVLQVVDFSSTPGKNHSLRITINGIEVERFDVFVGVSVIGEDPLATSYDPPGFDELRASVNQHSSFIEMPARGTDFFDLGGVDGAVLTPFGNTFMTGGTGGPRNDSLLSQIRTGPDRTIIIIQTTEDQNGSPITPTPSKRIQQWNGTEWITYTPNEC